MPTLERIGKEKAMNHHQDVAFEGYYIVIIILAAV